MSKTYIFQEIRTPVFLKIKKHEGFLYVLNTSEFETSDEVYLKSIFEKYILNKIKEIAYKENIVAIHILLDGSLYGLVNFLKKNGFQLNDDMLSMVYSFFSRKFTEVDNKYKLPDDIILAQFEERYLDDWIECIKDAFKHKESLELIKRNFNVYWTNDTTFDKKLHLEAIDSRTRKVVGIISCFYYKEQRAGHIKLVAVKKEYQNKGIGKVLVQEILKRLSKMPCNYVSLDVNALNVSAIHIYKKLGFEIKNNLSLTKVYFNHVPIRKSIKSKEVEL